MEPRPVVAAIRALRLGNYQPLVELAAGGMATVYVARQVGAAGFERLVVIKRVHPHLVNNRDFSTMFQDEARVCATIRHPNVVPVIDVVESNGELFLVLEYVESVPLSALVKAAADQGKLLSPRVLARIFTDALSGLHAAHEAVDLRGEPMGLIHRDVSPQNIIVGVDGTSRLIDFGIAKAVSRISVTSSGVVKGKLRYMSPEQVMQRPLDRRADVFAAGVVLFESLTGRRLFGGDDEGDIALGILLGETPAASSIVPDLPVALDAVLEKALARKPDERFSTALELQEALERELAPAPAREVARVVASLSDADLALVRAALQSSLVESSPRLQDAPASDASMHERSRKPSGTERASVEPTLVEPLLVGRGAPAKTRSHRMPALAAGALLAVVVGFGIQMRGRPIRPEAVSEPAPILAASASAAPATSTAEVVTATPPMVVTPASSASSPHLARKPDRSRSSPALPPPDLHRRNPYGTP